MIKPFLITLCCMLACIANIYGQAPVITSFSPASGPVGTSITISGKNFNATAANNRVWFGAVSAIPASATSGSLVVKVPAGASFQPLSVLNTATRLSGNSNKVFCLTTTGEHGIGVTQFGPHFTLPQGIVPSSANVVDIDGDGKPDVVAGFKNSSEISVYRNIGGTGVLNAQSFGPRISIVVNDLYPSVIKIADMDGDGKPDIVSNYNGYGFAIFHNSSTPGNIVLDKPVSFSIGQGVTAFEIGDMDSDGKPDIVAIANTNSKLILSVFKNTIAGGLLTNTSFSTRIDIAPNTPATDLALCDIDADGKQDIALVNNGLNTVSIMQNITGAGTIAFDAKIDFQTGISPWNLAAADLDGDNKADLVVTNTQTNGVSVYFNKAVKGKFSTGTLATKVDLPTASGTSRLKIADIDADGKPDILALSANIEISGITMFRNLAVAGKIDNTSFDTHTDFSILNESYVEAMAFGDLDGDGKPDLVTISDSVKVFKNGLRYAPVISNINPIKAAIGKTVTIQGKNFSTVAANNIVYFGPVQAKVSTASATQLSVVVPAGASYAPVSVVNVDTRLSAESNTAFIPTFDSKHALSKADFEPKIALASFQNISGVSFHDIDGDGKPDMVLSSTNNGVVVASIYRNVSVSGSISASSFPVKVDFPTMGSPQTAIYKDINGDGKPDVLIFNKYNSSISCYLNKAVPGIIDLASFGPRFDLGGFSNASGYNFADLDNDGRPDMIETISDPFSSAGFVINRNVSEGGKLGFDNPIFYKKDGPFRKVITGDLDNDGRADLVLATPDSSIVIYQNLSENGNIRLSDKSVISINASRIGDIKLADVNGDSKPDLVVAYSGYDFLFNPVPLVAVFRNISVGNTLTAASFAAPVTFAVATGNFDLSISDFDGDGKPDILLNDGNVSLLRNNSTANVISFGSKVDITDDASLYSTYDVSSGLAAYDLDRDGKQDIVYSDYNAHTIWFIHNKPQPAAVAVTPPVISSFSPATAYNGDEIAINGSNFGGSAATNMVYFGAVQAKVISAGGTQLKVQVPAGSNYAPLVVLNKTTGLQAAAVNPFVNKFKGSGQLDSKSFKMDMSLGQNWNSGQSVIGDIDNDGKPDIVYTDAPLNETELVIRRNVNVKDSIAFSPIVRYGLPGGVNNLILSDVDGDGKLDVIVSYADEYFDAFSIFRNTSTTGKISFAPKIDITHRGYSNLAAGDLNGDGKPDLIAIGANQNYGSQVFNTAYAFPNTSVPGRISFGTPSVFGAQNAGAIAITDVDGDNKPDLVLNGVDGFSSDLHWYIAVLRNTSAGGGISFAGPVKSPVNARPDVIQTGDIDGDGKPDIMVTPSFKGALFSILRNRSTIGKIAFSNQDYPTTENSFVTLGDVNGDGKPDLFTVSRFTNVVSVYQNNAAPGKIAFKPKVDITAQRLPTPVSVTIGDLNADGKADMVLTYNYYNTGSTISGINIFKNVIQQVPVPTITANGPLTFAPGKNVVLTAHPDTGFTYQWMLDGNKIKNATNPTLTVSKTGSYSVAIALDTITRSSDAVSVNVVFTLPADNFQLKITGASCKGSNNGAIGITAKTSMAYTATITGNGLNKAYPFNTSVNIPDLAAGTYSVCMTVADQPDYQQCFTAIVTEPKDLSVYSTVNDADQTITVTMDGGAQYNIKLNGSSYSTTESSITLPLSQGDNKLEVSTDRLCQGLIQKLISYSNKIIPYPVPFENSLSLNLGAAKIGNVNVTIHDVADGKLVFSKQYTNQSGILQLNVSQLKSGVYGLHLTMGTTEKIFKILKK